jgi:hypothetical protein
MGKDLFGLENLESASMDEIMKLDLFGEGTNMGVSETPSGKPYDAAAVSVPKSSAITAEVYNSALAALKKSFKEGVEIMEMLENVTVVEGADVETLQAAYTEAVIEDAIFESYVTGPYFEAAKNPDKSGIKKVISGIRKAAPEDNADKYHFMVFKSMAKDIVDAAKVQVIAGGIATALIAAITYGITKNTAAAVNAAKGGAALAASGAAGSAIGAGIGNITAKMLVRKLRENSEFKMSLWQMAGTFNIGKDSIETALEYYSNEFKEQLGEGYVLNAVKIRLNYGKDYGDGYILIVDTKKEKLGTIELKFTAEDLK